MHDGVFLVHLDLFDDHLLLAGHLGSFKLRIEKHVVEQIDSYGNLLSGDLDPVTRQIFTGIGIILSAVTVELFRDIDSFRTLLRAFEHQVFNEVGTSPNFKWLVTRSDLKQNQQRRGLSAVQGDNVNAGTIFQGMNF